MPAIIALAAWNIAKLAAKFFFLSAQIAVSALIIISLVSAIVFVLYIILFVYNKYDDFIALIASYTTQSEILTVAMQLMNTLGIIKSFNDVFAIFSPMILLYLGFKATMIGYRILERASNELFKVGVITQQ